MLVAPITDYISIASNWWFCLTIVLRAVGRDISWGCSLMINFDGTWSSTPLSKLFDFQRVAKRSCHWKAPTRKSNDAGFCRMFQLYSFLWESVEAPQKVVVPPTKRIVKMAYWRVSQVGTTCMEFEELQIIRHPHIMNGYYLADHPTRCLSEADRNYDSNLICLYPSLVEWLIVSERMG